MNRTIASEREQALADRRDAERRHEHARAALRRMAADAGGADRLTGEAAERAGEVARRMYAAKDDIMRADGKLAILDQAAAEEDEIARRSAESHPVDLPGRPAGASLERALGSMRPGEYSPPASERARWLREDGRPAAVHPAIRGVITRSSPTRSRAGQRKSRRRSSATAHSSSSSGRYRRRAARRSCQPCGAETSSIVRGMPRRCSPPGVAHPDGLKGSSGRPADD